MNKKCPVCGCEMRNGRTGSGAAKALPCVWGRADPRQRLAARDLRSFVDGCCRRKPSSICRVRADPSAAQDVAVLGIWPMPEVVDDSSRGAVDGHLDVTDLVVLIACSELHVLSWHLPAPRRPRLGGRCGASRRLTWWSRRRLRVRPGSGEGVAGDEGSKMHFHAFCQVRRKTTRSPNLQAGKGAGRAWKEFVRDIENLSIKPIGGSKGTCNGASSGRTSFEETSIVDGRKVYTAGESARRGRG